MIRTAGTWSREERPLYFIASKIHVLKRAAHIHPYLLCALNEMEGPGAKEMVRDFLRAGRSVFLDSGVFSLIANHARAHNMKLPEVLSIEPERIDGYAELWDAYVALMREMGDRAWGYVEIDLGGREKKIETRAKLEAQGFRPIPVYHPLSDGWDYFDYLAERYDRICFSNVSHATMPERVRLIATAWERRKKYPHLWIHMLGFTPSEMVNAFPIDSCDSSTWVDPVRWHHYLADSALKKFTTMPDTFKYRSDVSTDHPCCHYSAYAVCGYEAGMLRRNQRNIERDYAEALRAKREDGT